MQIAKLGNDLRQTIVDNNEFMDNRAETQRMGQWPTELIVASICGVAIVAVAVLTVAIFTIYRLQHKTRTGRKKDDDDRLESQPVFPALIDGFKQQEALTLEEIVYGELCIKHLDPAIAPPKKALISMPLNTSYTNYRRTIDILDSDKLPILYSDKFELTLDEEAEKSVEDKPPVVCLNFCKSDATSGHAESTRRNNELALSSKRQDSTMTRPGLLDSKSVDSVNNKIPTLSHGDHHLRSERALRGFVDIQPGAIPNNEREMKSDALGIEQERLNIKAMHSSTSPTFSNKLPKATTFAYGFKKMMTKKSKRKETELKKNKMKGEKKAEFISPLDLSPDRFIPLQNETDFVIPLVSRKSVMNDPVKRLGAQLDLM
jgi:hypothetical protein